MEVLENLKHWFPNEYPSIETKIINFRSFVVETTNYNSYIYFFEIPHEIADSIGIPNQLILKLSVSNEGHFPDSMRGEFHNLHVLQQHDLPTPQPVGLIENLMGDGRLSIIMERMEGLTLTIIIREKLRSDDEIDKIFIECIELFEKIHRLPSTGVFRFNEPDIQDLKKQLDDLRLLANSKNYTNLDWMYNWLDSNIQEFKPLSNAVNHGDYQADNILVDENNQISIVDWDWMHRFGFRDIRFDLAWSYVVNYGLIGSKWADAFLELYTKKNNLEVKEIEYFVVFLQYLMGVMTNTQQTSNPYPEDKLEKFKQNGIGMRKNSREMMLRITGIDIDKL